MVTCNEAIEIQTIMTIECKRSPNLLAFRVKICMLPNIFGSLDFFKVNNWD